MPKSEIFRINYYVGAVLAQGGNIWIDDSMIVFSPTSAIDRAMGAKDVQISFDRIKALEFKGELMRTFTVSTGDKIHKFEGSQARRVWDVLEKTVPNKNSLAIKGQSVLKCAECRKDVAAHWFFCAFCGTKLPR
jgi:hypothetical protein